MTVSPMAKVITFNSKPFLEKDEIIIQQMLDYYYTALANSALRMDKDGGIMN